MVEIWNPYAPNTFITQDPFFDGHVDTINAGMVALNLLNKKDYMFFYKGQSTGKIINIPLIFERNGKAIKINSLRLLVEAGTLIKLGNNTAISSPGSLNDFKIPAGINDISFKTQAGAGYSVYLFSADWLDDSKYDATAHAPNNTETDGLIPYTVGALYQGGDYLFGNLSDSIFPIGQNIRTPFLLRGPNAARTMDKFIIGQENPDLPLQFSFNKAGPFVPSATFSIAKNAGRFTIAGATSKHIEFKNRMVYKGSIYCKINKYPAAPLPPVGSQTIYNFSINIY